MDTNTTVNVDEPKKKESILFKKLDLAFVYVFIFIFGMIIVFVMTSYLNNKVKELLLHQQVINKNYVVLYTT